MNSAETASGPFLWSWFCLRTQPKHEHIAAGHLKEHSEIEVYLPRIRFKRSTRRGPVWFTEALFPNYLFARFDLARSIRLVRHVQGIRGIVHFGNQWPTVPDSVIAELRATVGANEIHVVAEPFKPGDAVHISGGAFHGLEAVVTRAMPGRQRVAVLLEFLGRQSMVELSPETLVRAEEHRRLLR